MADELYARDDSYIRDIRLRLAVLRQAVQVGDGVADHTRQATANRGQWRRIGRAEASQIRKTSPRICGERLISMAAWTIGVTQSVTLNHIGRRGQAVS
jgi:hypothetical protein